MDFGHLHQMMLMMHDFDSLPATHAGRFISGQASNSSNSSPSTANSSQLNAPNKINHQNNGKMAIITIVVILILMGFFLFYCKNRRPSQIRIVSLRQQRRDVALPERNGLDPEMVEEFPLMRYSSCRVANGGRGSMDCSVCLTEFQEDERLRVLPKCGHFFHADCIDMWLNSHSTCPLCRISLLPTSLDQIAIASPPDAPLPELPPQEGEDLQLTKLDGGQAQRLMESMALRPLPRNSVRRSMSMEPRQVFSAVSTDVMEAEGDVRGKAHVRYGSLSLVSDRMRGSKRSTSINKSRTFSMPLLPKRSEGREWVSIDLDASTEPTSSLSAFNHHDQKSHQ